MYALFRTPCEPPPDSHTARLRDGGGVLSRMHQRGVVARHTRRAGGRTPPFMPTRIPNPTAVAPLRSRRRRPDTTPDLHEWILPYHAVRVASDPEAMVAEFFESTYETAATLAGWDIEALRSSRDGDR